MVVNKSYIDNLLEHVRALQHCKDTAIESGAWESYKSVGAAFDNLQKTFEAALAEKDKRIQELEEELDHIAYQAQLSDWQTP